MCFGASSDLSEGKQETKDEEDNAKATNLGGFNRFDYTDYESDQDDDDDFEWNQYLCHVYNIRVCIFPLSVTIINHKLDSFDDICVN